MKTIEQAAIESAKSKLNKLYDENSLRTAEHICGFKACAEFMEQMIPVSEELPSDENGYINEPVIIQDRWGDMAVGIYTDGEYWDSQDERINTDYIVSWRPLNRK